MNIRFPLPLAALVCWLVPPTHAQEARPDVRRYNTQANVLYRTEGELTGYMRERCRLDLYYPVGTTGFLTVVWFHGGGLTNGERFVPEGLKEKGIGVVAAGYRLSPRAKSPAYVEDAAAAVAWTFRHIGEYGGATKPNIVYILADDLGYGDVGCYNPQSKIPTPRLDRLAAQGMRFTDAHAPDSVCTPSRYGLLTGRYCFRSRLKSSVLGPWGAPLIEQRRLTVPALLRQQGYATACIGKWHLGWQWPTKDGRAPSSQDGLGNVDFTKPMPGGPMASGFDSYFGVDLPNYPPYCFIDGDRTVGTPSQAAPMTKGGFNRPGPMVPGWNLTNILPEITARAVRYIENAAKSPKPFFLYFPLTAPHYPIVPTAEFKGRSQAGDYGDFVAQVDATVGAVLDALNRTGLAGNTLVIFTSDNGPECVEAEPGAYQRIRDFGHWSMDGLRGVKRDTWEGGHRVPFLAWWPGRILAGAVNEETICHVDFLATCAALLGARLPPDAGEDSYNILPLLLGEKHGTPIREATVLHGGDGKFALRQREWVFIDAPTGDGNGQHGEPQWCWHRRGSHLISSRAAIGEYSRALPEDCPARSRKHPNAWSNSGPGRSLFKQNLQTD